MLTVRCCTHIAVPGVPGPPPRVLCGVRLCCLQSHLRWQCGTVSLVFVVRYQSIPVLNRSLVGNSWRKVVARAQPIEVSQHDPSCRNNKPVPPQPWKRPLQRSAGGRRYASMTVFDSIRSRCKEALVWSILPAKRRKSACKECGDCRYASTAVTGAGARSAWGAASDSTSDSARSPSV